MQVLGFLAIIFGPIMEWIYRFIPNYGWALIVFTLLVNLVLLPLRIKQQKSTARMSAFQPKMQEIQKKYSSCGKNLPTHYHPPELDNENHVKLFPAMLYR